jgi:sugar phosphate isomerase/epimerase
MPSRIRMNRRTCLKHLGVAAGGILVGPSAGGGTKGESLSASGSPGRVQSALGLQLFTVRDLLRKDLEGTLAEVAALGFVEVEMFGFGGNAFIEDPLFGLSAAEMRRTMQRHGLAVQCAQISGRVDAVGPIAEVAHELGIRHLIIGMAREFLSITTEGPVVSGVKDADQIRRLAERLNGLGSLCRKDDLRLGYHNHHMEFARLGSTRAYDLLLQHTDPELVLMELDVGWAKAGGVEPQEYLAKYPGRFVSCHLKDFAPDRPLPADLPRAPIPEMARMVAPGEGVVDFVKVLSEMDRQHIEHGFVECDLPADAMEVARRGIRYLEGLTY